MPKQRITLLKYLGGKFRFRHIIEPMYNKHSEKRWVDLFCGGLSLPLNMQPKRVLINDKNPDLINLYKTIRDMGDSMPKVELKNEESFYYNLRKEFNAESDRMNPVNAHKLYVMNKTSFNGLIRYNKSGEYNSPFGHYHSPGFIEDFEPFQAIMKNWEIQCGPWQDVKIADDDFVVADPPYVTDFTEYTPGGFNWEDQIELATFLSKLDNPIILHNQSKPEVLELYESLGFNIQYYWREDKINSHRKAGNKVIELIATRNI